MIKVSKSTTSTLNEVQIGLDHIARTLELLESHLRTLEKNWDGEAKEAFAVAQSRWRHQLASLNALASSARRFSQDHVESVSMFDDRRANAWKR